MTSPTRIMKNGFVVMMPILACQNWTLTGGLLHLLAALDLSSRYTISNDALRAVGALLSKPSDDNMDSTTSQVSTDSGSAVNSGDHKSVVHALVSRALICRVQQRYFCRYRHRS